MKTEVLITLPAYLARWEEVIIDEKNYHWEWTPVLSNI